LDEYLTQITESERQYYPSETAMKLGH